MNKAKLEKLENHARENAYLVHGDISRADCAIGFSFGYLDSEQGILPGKSNEQLAAFIEKNLSNTPLILQFEINDALKSAKANLVIKESRVKGEYLNSKEIGEQALIFMKKNGWCKAVIVTHPAMEARNDAICSKLGIETITPPGLEAIEYDPNSAQPWTRDRNSWWQREQLVIKKCYEENWI